MGDPIQPDSAEPGAEAPLAIDYDADGTADLVAADTTGDGLADVLVETTPEGGTVTIADTDGRPGWDLTAVDQNADGRPETVSRDLDADGRIDLAQADTDADGYLETTTIADGTTYRTDPATGLVIAAEPAGDPTQAPLAPEPAPTDQGQVPWPDQGYEATPSPATPVAPATPTDQEGIHGDFVDDRPYAQIQTEDGFCAPVSVGMVVSEFLGRFVPESETVDSAIELGFLTHDSSGWSGLTVFETEALVEHYGIDAHIEPPVDPATGEFLQETTSDEAIDRLNEHLDADRGIILMVDGDEVWTNAEDDGTFGDGMDHAVVIRQVNEVNGTVTLNDPGNADGGQEWVMSIDDFLEAWDDSGYAMVVTDGAPEGAAPLAGDVPSGVRKGLSLDGLSYAGFVILPVVIAADRLRRRSRI